MKDEQIKNLFNLLREKVGVEEAELQILRVRGKKYILDGFTDPRFRRIILTINEDFPEVSSDVFSVVIIHELKHLKHPKFSEKIIYAETVKQYERIYEKPFPRFEETEIR